MIPGIKREEIARIVSRIPPATRQELVHALRAFSAAGNEVSAAGEAAPIPHLQRAERAERG
jgi:formate hydrogenlyase subunit 4